MVETKVGLLRGRRPSTSSPPGMTTTPGVFSSFQRGISRNSRFGPTIHKAICGIPFVIPASHGMPSLWAPTRKRPFFLTRTFRTTRRWPNRASYLLSAPLLTIGMGNGLSSRTSYLRAEMLPTLPMVSSANMTIFPCCQQAISQYRDSLTQSMRPVPPPLKRPGWRPRYRCDITRRGRKRFEG